MAISWWVPKLYTNPYSKVTADHQSLIKSELRAHLINYRSIKCLTRETIPKFSFSNGIQGRGKMIEVFFAKQTSNFGLFGL